MKTKLFKHQHHQESNEIPTKQDCIAIRRLYSYISSESEKENEEGIKATKYYSEEEIKYLIDIQRKSKEKREKRRASLISTLLISIIFYLMFAFVKMDFFWFITNGEELRALYLFLDVFLASTITLCIYCNE